MNRRWRGIGFGKRIVSGAGLALAGLATTLWSQEGGLSSAGAVQDSVQVGSLERTFLLHAPPGLPEHPALVIAFHGSGHDGANMRELVGSSLEPLAGARGFLVVYPDGYEKNWNDCRGPAPFPANRLAIDDVGFVRALVEGLVRERHVDPHRVFALGYSNGGHMAYRLALEIPGKVTAVAAFAAGLPVEKELDCRPSGRPVAVMAVLGTRDPLSPYDGGEMVAPNLPSRGHTRSGPASLAYFARLAGYTGPPVETTVVPAAEDDSLWVERASWTRPAAPEVVLFTVQGGGHVIPGPPCASMPAPVGPCERRFDGVAEAVRFFFAQPAVAADRRIDVEGRGVGP